jgi:heme/copper-type cytochrome/quinol oxidase subunit 2
MALSSEHRTRGFQLKVLDIDTDVPLGQTTETTVTPYVAGTFTAKCDHFCGLGDFRMKMTVVVR